MVSQQRIFFDFLQFCIGSVAEIPASVKDADWKVLYGKNTVNSVLHA